MKILRRLVGLFFILILSLDAFAIPLIPTPPVSLEQQMVNWIQNWYQINGLTENDVKVSVESNSNKELVFSILYQPGKGPLVTGFNHASERAFKTLFAEFAQANALPGKEITAKRYLVHFKAK